MKNITIDGVEYSPARETSKDIYCVRTESAGVFVGEIVRRDGIEVEMSDARRLWYWSGAASLSQLAMEGVAKPESCKFPCSVDSVILTGVIEIIKMTAAAVVSINEVPIWKE